MVNFRFHVISLVAVFLSLAIGISLGSGFIGDTALNRIKSDIDDVREQNQSVREENAEQRAQLDAMEGFATGARSLMIDGALLGEDVVMVRFDHTDTALTDAITASVEEADGSVASILTVTDKMKLSTPEEVAELAELVGTSETDPAVVRAEAAEHLGFLLGQAALQPPGPTDLGARERVAEFTTAMQEAGFMELQLGTGEEEVPDDAAFVIAGGGSAPAVFSTWRFAQSLAGGLLDRDAPVAVAERSESGWQLVPRIREDDQLAGSLVTVDHAETTAGQIALVLGLARATQGVTGHYGSDPGASSALPESSPD